MVTDPVVMVISISVTNKESVTSLIAPTSNCRKVLIHQKSISVWKYIKGQILLKSWQHHSPPQETGAIDSPVKAIWYASPSFILQTRSFLPSASKSPTWRVSFVPIQNSGKFGSSIGAYKIYRIWQANFSSGYIFRIRIKKTEKIPTWNVPAASPVAKVRLPVSGTHSASLRSSPVKSARKLWENKRILVWCKVYPYRLHA